MPQATYDITAQTRDDEAILDACNHLESYPLSDDATRLDRNIYQTFNDPLDENTYSSEIERDALLDATAGTKSEPVFDRLFDWYDSLGDGDITVEVSRAGGGAVKVTGGATARDSRYPPLSVTTTYPTSGRPSISIEGCQYTGHIESLWVGGPDDLSAEKVRVEAALNVMPSVPSRVVEFEEESGLRGRRATVLALTEVGLSDEEIADILPIGKSAVRSNRSKANASVLDAEHLAIIQLGAPKIVLGGQEVTGEGEYPRRYYVCEHVTDATVYLIIVDAKDSGPSITTHEYDSMDDLVAAHESNAEFMGWDDTLHSAAEEARSQ